MHPYRKAPPASGRAERTEEDRVVYGLAAVLGAARLGIGLAAGEWFGAELTIALLLVLFGCVGLVRR